MPCILLAPVIEGISSPGRSTPDAMASVSSAATCFQADRDCDVPGARNPVFGESGSDDEASDDFAVQWELTSVSRDSFHATHQSRSKITNDLEPARSLGPGGFCQRVLWLP